MSSFQGVGVERFHCIQRCPHFREGEQLKGQNVGYLIPGDVLMSWNNRGYVCMDHSNVLEQQRICLYGPLQRPGTTEDMFVWTTPALVLSYSSNRSRAKRKF